MKSIIETLEYVVGPVVGILLLIYIFAKLNNLFLPVSPSIVILLDFIAIAIIVVLGYSIYDRNVRHS